MKSNIDIHWNERATKIENDIDVNTMDVFQRELEFEYISRFLAKDMNALEVGCGNGFSTNYFRTFVNHIDSFDYSENMIERAKASFGEKNNRFFYDNILAPQHIKDVYDVVICVRVLVNLKNLEQQQAAIPHLASFVKPNGHLLLLEGFTEGFKGLSELREKVGLPIMKPARINFYSSIHDILPLLNQYFDVEDQFHLGSYDYLTRVFYPLIIGTENIQRNTMFHEKSLELARTFNPDSFESLSRLKGFVLKRRV